MNKSSEKFLTSQQVRTRYGDKSDMTLYRWVRNPTLGFPQPVVINGRRFWRLSELQAWEDNHSAQRAATS